MRDHDFLRVIGATILAAGIAVMSQDLSFRILPDSMETTISDPQYREMMLILKDPSSDQARQFKGDLKRHWANFTDADLSEVDGNYDRFLQKIQERYGDRTDELRQWVVEWFLKPADLEHSAQHG